MAPLMPKTSNVSSRTTRSNSGTNLILKCFACVLLVVCATLLVVSVWFGEANHGESGQVPITSLESQSSSPLGPPDADDQSKLRIEEGAKPNQSELKIARKLTDEGHQVVVRRVAPNGRTSDYLVNGIETELKTVSNLTGKDPTSALSSRILEGAGQARSIIVDVSEQVGMTRTMAERSILRVWGRVRADSIPIDTIRIIGKDFDVSSVYIP